MSQTHSSGGIKESKLSFSQSSVLSFKTGEVVTAKILQRLGPNTVLIQLKNNIIKAKTARILPEGIQAHFKVISTEKEIQLKPLFSLTSPEEIFLHALQFHKGKGRPLSEIQSALHRLTSLPKAVQKQWPDVSILNQLMRGILDLSGGQIKTLLESSGLFFENKLKKLIQHSRSEDMSESDLTLELSNILKNDLKGILLTIQNHLKDRSLLELLAKHKIVLRDLEASVELLLSEITARQIRSKQNHTLQYFLPVAWEGLERGEIILKKNGSKKLYTRDAAQNACMIQLDLGKAGKISIHIQMISKKFHLNFAAENPKLAERIQKETPELQSRFQQSDLQWGDLTVHHQEKIHFEQTIEKGIDIKV